MVWVAAASSLRAASEFIDFCISNYLHRYSFVVVFLHLRLLVYVVSTDVIAFFLLRLATALQRSTESWPIDRYGRESLAESDRDVGQIRLTELTIE